jgi:hypothetical protein
MEWCTPQNRNLEYAHEMSKEKSNGLHHFIPKDMHIRHAQLCMTCSKLKSHLFSLHDLDSTGCTCGFLNIEDIKHYLLHCPLDVNARQNMVTSLSNINNRKIDVSVLLVVS